MADISEIKKEMVLNIDSQPWTVIDLKFVNPGKGPAFYKLKLKNLKSGNTAERTVKSGENLAEAEIEKFGAKFLYFHRDRFFFCEKNNPLARFDLPEEAIGESSKFLKPNEIIEGIKFEGTIINISLPIKVQLKVTEAPPSFKGNTAQGGTKTVTLETGATINVPLFIKEGDVIEINTETGEYVRRVE